MEHHEATNNISSSNSSTGRADQHLINASSTLVPVSPPIATAAFRSVQISAPSAAALAPPSLQGRQAAGIQNLSATNKHMTIAQDDSLPLSLAQKKEAVGTIPLFPSYHIAERTAIQIPEDNNTTVNTLLDRIFHYLRVHSISYECEANSGCFDCMAPSMVGFVVQLWRRTNDNTGKQLWVEVQRREGCAIAMNAIRRSLLRHVKGGEPEPPAAAVAGSAAGLVGRRRPCSDQHQQTGSNKRQRSLSPHAARLNCQDALAISLRLLESAQKDQQKLGLESLTVLTDARLVSALDASTASRALILGEGPSGARLQQRFAALLRECLPNNNSSNYMDSYHASIAAMLYHIALHAIANALEQVLVSRDNNTDAANMNNLNLNAPFWQTTVACLLFSIEDATRRPHEAALSAKCIRYLLPVRAAAERLQVSATQTALRRTHELGRAHNLSLEEESQKTLCFFH